LCDSNSVTRSQPYLVLSISKLALCPLCWGICLIMTPVIFILNNMVRSEIAQFMTINLRYIVTIMAWNIQRNRNNFSSRRPLRRNYPANIFAWLPGHMTSSASAMTSSNNSISVRSTFNLTSSLIVLVFYVTTQTCLML
jgi:hypothetical protein